MDKPVPTTTRQLGAERVVEMLTWIDRFGVLDTKQIARLVYPHANQADRLARRTLRRLVEARLVIRRAGDFAVPDRYALSAGGARHLSAHTGRYIRSGKDLIANVSAHRMAANDFAVRLVGYGYDAVWTEREVQTNRAPVRMLGGKVADMLTAIEADSGYLYWVEVENSARGGRDLKALARWLIRVFKSTTGHKPEIVRDQWYLDRVAFYLATPETRTLPQRLDRMLGLEVGKDRYSPHDWNNELVFFFAWTDEIQWGF
jgi:hypothetical protein